MTDVEVLELLQAKGPMTLKELEAESGDALLKRLQAMRFEGLVYMHNGDVWTADDEIAEARKAAA